jgi:D-beta-D-heptose 7-phosphate kinase/D-beta-D-heptose 1-phosphate adenosyltransferase
MQDLKNIQPQTKYKILLIGDDCNDVYTYGYVKRISPEAPVPIFEPHYTIYKDGMAGNVRENLQALGCDVDFLRDKDGVSEKNRLIDERTKQQLLRIDKDAKSNPITFETAIPPVYDAIVISDYNKGTVTYELIEELVREVNVPIFVDTKKTDLARLKGCYVKINALEKSRATSLPDPEYLIITHGSDGAEWSDWVFPAEIAGDVVDVCGAGDTFLAALAYKFLETNKMNEAVIFANKAAAITVQHIGVYAPRMEEIK